MKMIIAGSRTASSLSFETFAKLVDCAVGDKIITEVVSGGARGADALGEKWAKSKGIPVKLFPADWDKFGKSAGYKRNVQMGEYADFAVIIWDGLSPGSKHMMDIMQKLKKPFKLQNFKLK